MSALTLILVFMAGFVLGVGIMGCCAAGREWTPPAPYPFSHGWYPPGLPPTANVAPGVNEVPAYSTSIAAAWEVVGKMWPLVNVGSGHGTYRFQLNRRDGDGWWVCELAVDPQGDWSTHKTAQAPTAPLAICLAALRAVGVEVPDA